MIKLKKAEMWDADFWLSVDRHIDEAVFLRKCRDGMAYLILEDEEPAGVLRGSFFWEMIPFLDLLFLPEEKRGRGIGKAAMTLWETEMKEQGYTTLLLSTQADEEAQHFYRRIGYTDCGCLLLNDGTHRQPAELFFKKELGE